MDNDGAPKRRFDSMGFVGGDAHIVPHASLEFTLAQKPTKKNIFMKIYAGLVGDARVCVPYKL